MPMNSRRISHVNTLMPGCYYSSARFRIGFAEYQNQGYTCQYGHSTPASSSFWMTWVEYISKEVRYPSHGNVHCDVF